MAESPYPFISDAYGKNHFELDRPFSSILKHFNYNHEQTRLTSLGEFAGTDLYEIADYIDKLGRPKLIMWSTDGERVDRVWLDPAEKVVLEKLIGEYGVNRGPYISGDWFHYFSSIYLIGDPGISCILTVTNQTAYAIYKYGDPVVKKFLPSLIGGDETTPRKELRYGATWFTEIQGGSDLGANLVEAVNQGGRWILNGDTKYFSSNA
ncbi:MAG: DNA alkylation response protein, partial [Nitrososphaerota archaeon]|nr:DNA alkylation response protein [Nitrososphaerota archaeon]